MDARQAALPSRLASARSARPLGARDLVALLAAGIVLPHFLRLLAALIIETHGDEIEQLEAIDQRLENAGVQEGRLGVAEHERGMDDDASMLEGAEPFDREFVDMMIAHHQGAIGMAHARLDKGENAELRELARATLRRRRSTR